MTRPAAIALTGVPADVPITIPFQRTSPAWIEPKVCKIEPETGKEYCFFAVPKPLVLLSNWRSCTVG